MNIKKSKVFVGPSNTSGNATYIANALRQVGVEAYSFEFSNLKHPFGYKTDFLIPQIVRRKNNIIIKLLKNRFTLRPLNATLRLFFFFRLIILFDTFIFISTKTLFRNKLDLRLLKFFNKKVVFRFCGCRERNPLDPLNQEKAGFCSSCKDLKLQMNCLCNRLEQKKSLIKMIEKYSDIIFTHKDTSGFLTETKKQFPVFHIFSNEKNDNVLDKFNEHKIIITHFPSNRLLKKSSFVDNVVMSVLQKYDYVEYFSERLLNDEVLVQLSKSHILIDQFTHYHGLLAVEGMANGCVIVGRISQWFKNERPSLPIINTEPEQLYDTIEGLINSRERMKLIAQKGLCYYKNFHSPIKVGELYKKIVGLN